VAATPTTHQGPVCSAAPVAAAPATPQGLACSAAPVATAPTTPQGPACSAAPAAAATETKPVVKNVKRARYMCFWRSLNGRTKGKEKAGLPKEVCEAYALAKGKRGGLLALYEDWLQSSGNWTTSRLVTRLTQTNSTTARGRFKVFNRTQLMEKYQATGGMRFCFA
jgi:hypothetical protein